MECSTKGAKFPGWEQTGNKNDMQGIFQGNWNKLQAELGIDLEQTAREMKAIQRKREIRSAADLLRMILFYALSDWGLRLCGAWALESGIGNLSDVAVLKRLRNSQAWLGRLVGEVLANRCSALRSMPGVRLRLLDATCVSKPGSQGVDWRTHLSFDLSNLCLDGIEVTDRYGGESLVRFQSRENEILVADAGYAFASGMGPVLASQSGLVVRINWRNVAVFTPDGQRFQMIRWLKTLSTSSEQTVIFETPQGWFPLRLIATPIPPKKAEEARRRVRLRYQRKQHPVTQDTLFAAGFVLLLTNLSVEAWPISVILFLYQIRWQVEITFKRLKSLLFFDRLRAKDPHLAQTYLFAKLLVALLLDQMIHKVVLQKPDWFSSLIHPANLSRLTMWFFESFRQIIFGVVFLECLHLHLFFLQRYFCDPPRSRLLQLAMARSFLISTAPASLSLLS